MSIRRDRDNAVVRQPETKAFLLTSEFWVAVAAAAAVLLAAYALDDIAKTTGWRFATWIAIAYIVSRGIAKAGSQRDYRPDPRRTDVDLRDGDGHREDDRYRNVQSRSDSDLSERMFSDRPRS
jgi:hypothetical protein